MTQIARKICKNCNNYHINSGDICNHCANKERARKDMEDDQRADLIEIFGKERYAEI